MNTFRIFRGFFWRWNMSSEARRIEIRCDKWGEDDEVEDCLMGWKWRIDLKSRSIWSLILRKLWGKFLTEWKSNIYIVCTGEMLAQVIQLQSPKIRWWYERRNILPSLELNTDLYLFIRDQFMANSLIYVMNKSSKRICT